jgi:hypothetical protein
MAMVPESHCSESTPPRLGHLAYKLLEMTGVEFSTDGTGRHRLGHNIATRKLLYSGGLLGCRYHSATEALLAKVDGLNRDNWFGDWHETRSLSTVWFG